MKNLSRNNFTAGKPWNIAEENDKFGHLRAKVYLIAIVLSNICLVISSVLVFLNVIRLIQIGWIAAAMPAIISLGITAIMSIVVLMGILSEVIRHGKEKKIRP